MLDSIAMSTLLDAPNGDLVLRISGTSRDGQLVRLRSPKCTIGSGPSCTFRVRARGVRPVHCLILRGPTQTVIRRWSADTRLNGGAFTDAPLGPGDRLGVGPVEFEVLDTGAASTRLPPPSAPARDAGPSPSFDGSKAVGATERRLALANRQARGRVRKLIAQLRAARGELAEPEGEPRSQETPPTAPEVRQGGLDALEAQLGTRQSALDVRERELDGRQAELKAVEAQLGTRQSALEARERELDGRQAELEALQSELSAASSEADRAKGPSAARPSRGASEEESIDQYMTRLLQRVRATTGSSASSEALTGTPDRDMGGPSRQSAAAPLATPAPGSDTSQDSAANRSPSAITRRSAAREDSANRSAMRELANVAAQAAIDHHARRRLVRLSTSKLMVILLALISGAAMLWTWRFLGAGVSTFYAGLVSFLIALYWGVQYAVLQGRVTVSRSGHLGWKSPEQPTPPPDPEPTPPPDPEQTPPPDPEQTPPPDPEQTPPADDDQSREAASPDHPPIS
jgi:hypothetical protein